MGDASWQAEAVRRLLLLIAGFALLGLAALGVALPVLPTTPFVLLAATCFASSSPRWAAWLARNRVFGPYIENYRNGGGVGLAHKVGALVFLWAGLTLSTLMVRTWWMATIAVVVAVGVSIHLVMLLPTRRKPAATPAATGAARRAGDSCAHPRLSPGADEEPSRRQR